MSIQTLYCRLPAQRSGIKGFLNFLLSRNDLACQRRALAKLDDAALADIGISRAQADAEALKSAWGVPAHWRQ